MYRSIEDQVAFCQKRDEVVVVPVVGSDWTCDGAQTQTLDIDDRTKQLPLLYLHKFNMPDDQIAAQEEAMANKADTRLAVDITMPALGYATVACRRLTARDVVKRSAKRAISAAEDTVVSSPLFKTTIRRAPTKSPAPTSSGPTARNCLASRLRT